MVTNPAAAAGLPHHEGHKAAVPAALPLLLISRPHDLDAPDGPEATKLASKVRLVDLQQGTHSTVLSKCTP